MKEKLALDDGYHETVVFLCEPLEVSYERKITEVVTPNGLSKSFPKHYTDGDAYVLIWNATGCQIQKKTESVLKHRISVPGIKINYNPTNLTLSYITKGKDNASRNWSISVKPELIKNGIEYSDYICNPFLPKKKSKNCYDDTVQDERKEE